MCIYTVSYPFEGFSFCLFEVLPLLNRNSVLNMTNPNWFSRPVQQQMERKEHSTLANRCKRSQGKKDSFVVLLSELRGKHLFLVVKKWENMPIISPRALSSFLLTILSSRPICRVCLSKITTCDHTETVFRLSNQHAQIIVTEIVQSLLPNTVIDLTLFWCRYY